jgi:fibronectin-binding autotransporter adhesin
MITASFRQRLCCPKSLLISLVALFAATSAVLAQSNGDSLTWNSTSASSWTSSLPVWYDSNTATSISLSGATNRNKDYNFFFAGTGTNSTVAPTAMTISSTTIYATGITFQNNFNLTNTTSISDGGASASQLVLGSAAGSALTTAAAWSITDNASSGTVSFVPTTSTGNLSFSLFSSGTFSVAAGGTLAISLAINDFDVTHTGGITSGGLGTVILSGTNNYSGGTTVNAGVLRLSGPGTLGATTGSLTMNGGTLDLRANQSVGALNGAGGTILDDAVGTTTLTIGNGNASGSFSGTITDHDGLGSGFVKLVKTGTGTQNMTSIASNYIGGTDINGGVLLSNSSNGGAQSIQQRRSQSNPEARLRPARLSRPPVWRN